MNKVIESKYDKHELFLQLRSYFRNPIQKKGYIAKECIDEEFTLAGESALAEYTMLGAPRLEIYAVYGKRFDKSTLSKELIDADKQVAVEVWGYDPKQFFAGSTVDKLSLIISLMDSEDERIEGAIEEIMGELWGE